MAGPYDRSDVRSGSCPRNRDRFTNTYVLTPDGIRVVLFYTKLHDRRLGPLLAADQPHAPIELRRALNHIEDSVDHYVAAARIKRAA